MKSFVSCIYLIVFFELISGKTQTTGEMISALQHQNATEKDAAVLARQHRDIAYLYAIRFQTAEAKKYADTSMAFALKSANNFEIVFSKFTLAKIYYLEDRTDTAIQITEDAGSLLKNVKNRNDETYARAYYYYMKGTLQDKKYKMDTAIYYYDKAITLINKTPQPEKDCTLLCSLFAGKAKSLVRLRKKGEAMALFIKAVKLSETCDDKINLMLMYYEYGFALKAETTGLNYCWKAAKMAEQMELEGYEGIYLHNIGSLYYNQGKYDSSYQVLMESTGILKNIIPVKQYIYALQDLSLTLIQLDSLEKAEAISREVVSYQDLSRLTYENFSSLVQLSEVLNKKGDYDEQWEIISIAEKLASASRNQQCIVTLMEQKAHYYSSIGNYKDALFYFTKIKDYRDSVGKIEAQQKLEEISIAYESEKKDNEIALLNAQQEISNTKLSRQRIAIFAASALAVLFGIAGFAVFKRIQLKRKTDLQIEKLERLNEIQELRTNIALDMHDDIGASLSSIRLYSEAVRTETKEKLPRSEKMLQKISENANEIVEHMSDIVWAINPKYDEITNLQNRMRKFAIELCAVNQITPEFIWNEQAQFNIPMETRRNIYLIFKEAVNNAVKYASCKTITIRLEENKHNLTMLIIDDGIGFDMAAQLDDQRMNLGNGLKNMRFRAKEIGGTLEINSTPGKGTSILFKLDMT